MESSAQEGVDLAIPSTDDIFGLICKTGIHMGELDSLAGLLRIKFLWFDPPIGIFAGYYSHFATWKGLWRTKATPKVTFFLGQNLPKLS